LLAILSTHPIQYQVPIWQQLAQRGRIPFRVFYMSGQGARATYDPGFGQTVTWDLNLLAGYDHEFLDVIEGAEQSSFGWLRLKTTAVRRLTGEDIGAVWVQGWQVLGYWQAVWNAGRRRLPVWLRAETNLRSTSRGLRRVFKRPLMAQMFRRIDRFLAIGEANRAFYLSQGMEPDRLAWAPYCVDNSRFAAQAGQLRVKRAQLRADWGIAEDARCILFVGKLIQKKRPLDLLRAAELLQARRSDLKLHVLFVGTGELGPVLRRNGSVAFDALQGVGAGTPPEPVGAVRTSFAGFLNQTEVAKAYVAADCLVLPSEATETWSGRIGQNCASRSQMWRRSPDPSRPAWTALPQPRKSARSSTPMTCCGP
jgi:glycosyltransferase involved in cell wall biosynthesis